LKKAFSLDGAHRGVSDLYDEASDALQEALFFGEDFDTGWYGVKHEIRSGRVRKTCGKIICEASASDDFDTIGYGCVELPAEAGFDTVIQALSDAEDQAESSRADSENFSGFAIHQLRPDGSSMGWAYTFIWPKDGDDTFPPTGDEYYSWGWQDGEYDDEREIYIGPAIDEMSPTTREAIERWCRMGGEHSMTLKCWEIVAWNN
jgi:hypothetical protein